MDVSMKAIHAQLRILLQVAVIHEFEWLQSEVNTALRSYSERTAGVGGRH
jgi:hypothetical protein